MYTISDNQSAYDAISQLIAKENQTFREFDKTINEKTTEIQNAKSWQDALKLALKLSHIILSYRAEMNTALSSLRDSFSHFEPHIKAKLKTHETTITNRMALLTDLHSELELVQRLSYANRLTI